MPIPLKEKVKNYDNLLTGKLINFVENPDSLGYVDGRWYSPKYDRRYRSGAFDPANFGIGIDRNTNEYVDNGELMFHKDSKGREYLTEAEERNVRNHSIANAEKSYAKRLSHAQETLHSNNIPSEIKKAITISAIYNLGQGYVANNLFEDNVLMDAFLNGSDLEYSNQVNRYYEKKRKGDRGIKTNRFIEQLQQEPVTIPNTIQGGGIRAEGGSLNSPKLWDDLSMTERAEMMRVAVNNGITDLPTIRQKYNEFAEGGPERDYNTWKKLIHDYKGIDVDNDKTYDYLSYYTNHTDEAWDMLNNAPDVHFYDTYKTAYHPTFSDESIYSGKYDLLHNPKGVVGGRWLENPNRFIPSPFKRDVDSLKEIADYISIAEPDGLQIRDEQERWPVIDGAIFGGVLPQVNVSPNLYPGGGPIGRFIKVPGDIASRVANLYNYTKTYLKTKLSGTGNGTFIDLSKQNVSRIKNNTKGVKSILTNEFVEYNNNTVRKKKDFINTNDTLLGDKNIPLSNISTFYGIENGKLKAGPLSIFDDGTLVIPNRTKSTPKLKKIIIPPPETIRSQSEIEDSIINAYNVSHGYKQNTFNDIINTIFPWTNPMSPKRVLYNNEGRGAITRVLNESSYISPDVYRKAITEHGDTIPLPFINSSPKVLFADETGNAAFVSNLGNPDNVTKLNTFLDKNPSYPVMVDNGRYSSYMTTLPNVSVYSGLNSPDSMFIIGTTDTNKHSNGGRIHIKPENRGKFTALKEKTGHSATWFKQHGTPAQRKMATFALNARKWKHPDGGPLVVDDYTYYGGSLPAVTVSAPALPAYQDQFTGQWYGIGPGGRKVNKPTGFDPSGARVYNLPEAFERARLGRAYADDYNHFGEFGDMVRGLATDLVMAPAGDIVAEPLGLLGSRIYGRIKPLFKRTISPAPTTTGNLSNNNVFYQLSKEQSALQRIAEETQNAAENGRATLLEFVKSPQNKQRWESAFPDRNVNVFIKDLTRKAEEVPFDFTHNFTELRANGQTVPNSPNVSNIRDITVYDYNTGLNVQIANNIGKDAYSTGIHEPIHYMTSISNGVPNGSVSEGLMGKSYRMFNTSNGKEALIFRGNGYEHEMIDFNDGLLPPVNEYSGAYLTINKPERIKDILVSSGRTPKEAESLINATKKHYEYMLNKQENQTQLKTWFLEKIKPYLKDPNNPAEIEAFLNNNPQIISNEPYIEELITYVRPGDNNRYANALAKMLYTTLGPVSLVGVNNNIKKN